MAIEFRKFHVLVFTLLCLPLGTALGASPTAEQALKLTPIQKDVEFDRPAAAIASKCTIKAEQFGSSMGWVVRDPTGQVLRNFVDTNGDNTVDRWGYFKDGLEVYRDIDSNFNGKADQYRWLNTAGTRWGLDRDEDGRIDSWKSISPEELTAEVVAALRDRDSARFARLVMSPKELKTLGLGAAKEQDLTQRINAAPTRFRENLAKATSVTPETIWVYFGGTRPGIVPAGTDDSSSDLEVYENVVAMVETQGKHSQVPIGTLVRVGDLWRMVDAPDALIDLADRGPGFFQSPEFKGNQSTNVAGQPSDKSQKLLTDLEDMDRQIARAKSPEEQSKLNDQRADLLEQLASEAGSAEDRAQWLRQLADTVGAAVQSGGYDAGVTRLQRLYEKLREQTNDAELAAYYQYRLMSADYAQKLQQPGANYADIQKQWLVELEKFVNQNKKSTDADDAMLQLAIAHEFAGDEDKALDWYGDIIKNFPSSPSFRKAIGAKKRLESVGQPLTLRGKSPAGGTVDLAKYKGKVVLIQYWATWCEPCKADMAQLKELQQKYNKAFAVIGVSLDSDTRALEAFIEEYRLPWDQIHEEGGLESRLANELGIVVVPTMILVDRQGNVVNRNVHVAQLDNELKAIFGVNSSAKNSTK